MIDAANPKLRTSPHLVIIPRQSDYAVYHRRRGGLCLVDSATIALVNRLKVPADSLCVVRESHEYKEDEVGKFIRFFRARGFLIEEERDEETYLAARIIERMRNAKVGRQIALVQLIISNLCNLRCRYCFEANERIAHSLSGQSRSEAQSHRQNLTVSHSKMMRAEDGVAYLEQVFALARRVGNRSLTIQFFGGEPLVNWKAMKKILTHFGRGERHQISLHYVVVTNGSIMTDDIARTLKEFDVAVVVSFDSPKSEARPLASGRSSRALVERGLTLAKRYGNRVAINAVYGDVTFNDFDLALVDFALDHDVFEIGVLLDLDPAFYGRRSADETVDKLYKVYRYGRSKGIIVTGYWHMIFQNLVDIDRFDTIGYKNCSALGCQLSIEPSGEVFACKACSVRLGHVMHLSQLLQSQSYNQYAVRACRSPQPCINCEIEHFCTGLCVGSIEKKYGNIESVESAACEVYRRLVACLIADASAGQVSNFQLH